jgi:hypothetical protein
MAWRIEVALGLAGGIIQVAFALIRPSQPPLLRTAQGRKLPHCIVRAKE